MKKYAKTYSGMVFLGAGVILYNKDEILMQKIKGRNFWEDFGGRTDEEDKNVKEAAMREASEESNHVLNKNYLKRLISNNTDKCYYLLQENKYFIIMIYVSGKEKRKLTSDIFGTREEHDGIDRKVEWVKRDVKLHPRILTLD
jgi:8-oxo-dGTP pyrophosphatase MutT (NUDIX family)